MKLSSLPTRFFRSAFALGLTAILTSSAHAASNYADGDYLVKLAPNASLQTWSKLASDAKVSTLMGGWVRVKAKNASRWSPMSIQALKNNPDVLAVQPNYRVHLLNDFKVTNAAIRAQVMELSQQGLVDGLAAVDNPAIPPAPPKTTGADPMVASQWGMMDIGARDVGVVSGKEITVAVIDTGVDYTHEDLVGQMWRNPGESGADSQGRDKSANGVDDDGNGYIDDIVGWDFASGDNKPFDLTVGIFELLLGGGNPGHGTHCAGNVGAGTNNGKGIMGAGQNIKIMAIRFLSEKGQGTTADAITAVRYAVANKADVLSNSWGSEGEDPADGANNQALRDAITYAQQKGKLFIAAAGNGHQGVGYDNDSDAKPGFPASYPNENIVSVAAIDVANQLGAFSNWGATTVDIAAPGVKVFSTTPGSYQDTVIDLRQFGIDIVATWDGTSMATPHVAGAAALYWSTHPDKTWSDVKKALLDSAVKMPQFAGKMTSGGKLNLKTLLAF